MRTIFYLTGWLLLFVSVPTAQAQQPVRYDLYVRDTVVNFTGKSRHAIAVNGQIPMPELTFTQGDTAEIWVHNELKEGTALHWHGLILPNREDGVPWLTQLPIKPGTSHLYRFPIIQSGTHWYHSHFGLQEQIGMYGAMTLKKRKSDPTFRKGIDDLPEIPVVLSEWTDLNPHNVDRMLHTANDWFAIRKNAVQSYGEALREGHFGIKLGNEWKRMLAMDVSDVYYDRVFINGKTESNIPKLKAGDKVRLRVSNGGGSSHFWLRYAGGKMTVVASDGNDVEPVEVDRLIIGVSETYDVVLTVPKNGTSYEFSATTEDRTQATSLFVGSGQKKKLEPMPRLSYFAGMKMMNGMMKMNGDMNDMGMNMSLQKMDMNRVMYPEVNSSSGEHTSQMDMGGENMSGKTGMDMQDHMHHNMTMDSSAKNAMHKEHGIHPEKMDSETGMDMQGDMPVNMNGPVTLNYA
ncbi:MAG: multicopper oxidase domain-containing protein, partial [Mucilaginibacter polytrichastri]|nr:multicopper oxidase domain-containing protein [Mucilaginibacter polytrichastri]